MTIGILGAGYVGLATAASFAARGCAVVCADVNPARIACLQRGELPFFEEGMLDVFREAPIPVSFTLDGMLACKCDVVFCCVGTPSAADGSADLSFVEAAATMCAETMPNAVFVLKSTVPPGTSRRIQRHVRGQLRVAANPEFLKEGSAVQDALHPSRIVLGADDPTVLTVLLDLYQGVDAPVVTTDTVTAEMVKYASNSFLATKVSFINEIANLCEEIGADVLQVARGMGFDDRIGPKNLQPGPGYGGSCFPKDVRALMHLGNEVGVPLKILSAVTAVNDERQQRSFQCLLDCFGSLQGKRIALWGLAFKPGTDDIRDAPALALIEKCLAHNATVAAYDPLVREAITRHFPSLQLAPNALAALNGADALVVMTDWPEFRLHHYNDIANLVASNMVIDLRFALQR
jgi:UDPglucose 6-dehydrogenase